MNIGFQRLASLAGRFFLRIVISDDGGPNVPFWIALGLFLSFLGFLGWAGYLGGFLWQLLHHGFW
jgi:hypothetical protein